MTGVGGDRIHDVTRLSPCCALVQPTKSLLMILVRAILVKVSEIVFCLHAPISFYTLKQQIL